MICKPRRMDQWGLNMYSRNA